MLALDEAEDPNFGDTDYQLAAYAAALRVLTGNAHRGDRRRARAGTPDGRARRAVARRGVIRNAVRIACDHLVPRGLDRHLWRTLTSIERYT